LPAEWKIHDGWTKWIVREATMNLMPNKVRERKDKLGFSVPQTEWLMTYQLNLWELYECGRKRDSLNIVSHEAIEKSWDKIFSSQLYWKEQNFIFRYVSYLVWLESFDLSY
jgi:asparagine synthase (glutamine-hydrolysing)